MACGRMGSGGFGGGELLMVLLLEQIVVPVVLLEQAEKFNAKRRSKMVCGIAAHAQCKT